MKERLGIRMVKLFFLELRKISKVSTATMRDNMCEDLITLLMTGTSASLIYL
jgi:hypothetical protein